MAFTSTWVALTSSPELSAKEQMCAGAPAQYLLTRECTLLERRVPTLVVASARDRLLPSLAEAGRLVSLIPGALRVVLPDSGHTALLESSVRARPALAPRLLEQAPDVWLATVSLRRCLACETSARLYMLLQRTTCGDELR